MKPLIDCIRDFIMTYPELKDGCLMIDYLGDKPVEYAIEAVPCDPVYRKYTDGGCMKQFLFTFASREVFAADVSCCTDNLAFYEEFERWITGKNNSDDLPDLDGREPVSIEVLTGGYAFSADGNTARYQIQLRLLYEEE